MTTNHFYIGAALFLALVLAFSLFLLIAGSIINVQQQGLPAHWSLQ